MRVSIVSAAPHASISLQGAWCGVWLGRVRVRPVSCPPSCTGPAPHCRYAAPHRVMSTQLLHLTLHWSHASNGLLGFVLCWKC